MKLPDGFVLDDGPRIPEGFVLDTGTSVADTARARLAARGLDPNIPIDDQTPNDAAPGFWQGLSETALPSWEGVKAIPRLAMELGATATGPTGTAGVLASSPNGPLMGIGAAQGEQGQKAAQAFSEGRISEGVGHGAAAALPLVGPAAANAAESFAEGDIAYGAGQATGLLAEMLVPKIVPASTQGLTNRAGKMIANAEKQYGSVFGRAAKSKATVEKVVPEMMDRGIRIKDPKALAADADAAASAIDIDAMIQPGQTIPSQAILDGIRAAQREQFNIVNNQLVPKDVNSAAIVEGLQEYGQIIRQHSVNGVIDAKQALDLRRTWEERIGSKYANPDAATSNAAEVRMDAADSLRDPLNQLPGIRDANKEKHFQLNVQRIAEAAPVGKTPGQVIADGGKYMVGAGFANAIPGVGNVASGLGVFWGAQKILRELPKTPAFKTASAIHKRNFAKALQAGDYVTAAEVGAGIVSGTLVADDYGTREAFDQIKMETGELGPEAGPQTAIGKSAVYTDPSGREVSIPFNILTATFRSEKPDGPDSPMHRWLLGMQKQGKIKSGGRLMFIDR